MDIERELSSHRFATLRAIETGRVELAIVRLNAFVKFAEAYLNAATVRGIRFPPGAANSVSIIDWRTPTQIIDFAADGILAAIRSGNRELIGTAAYLPIQFMRMSVERGDFLFYERMSQIFSSMLAESYSMNSDSSRRLVADLSYRYLREFADYLLPNLVASHEETLREQFAKDLLRAFGELMKVALDRNDLSTFAAIGNDMNSLFQHLDIAGLSKDAASSLRSFAEHERLVVWFGLGAWLLRGVVMRNAKPEPGAPDLRLIDASRIPVFLDVVSRNFSSINQLAGVFENALSRDRGSSNWEWWMLQTLPERKAHWGGFDQWLIYFYVIAGMRMSQNGNPATSDIPSPSRDLDARLNEIRKIVEEVRKDPKTWEPIIPWATGLEARNAEAPIWKYFIAANEAAVNEWQRRREDKVISAPLDERRVRAFGEAALKGWQDRSWMTLILTQMAGREDLTWQTEAKGRRVYELQPKQFFIDIDDTALGPLGYFQGTALGDTVSEDLLSTIIKVAIDQVDSEIGSVYKRTSDIVASMSTANASLAVFVVGDLSLERQYTDKPDFVPQWQQQSPRFSFHEYIGDINGIPCFFEFDQHRSEVIVCDLSKIGTLQWYMPTDNNVNGPLVKVTPISIEEASRLLTEQPALGKDTDGNQLPGDEAIRHLQLHVLILVEVRYDLKVIDQSAARKVTIRP